MTTELLELPEGASHEEEDLLEPEVLEISRPIEYENEDIRALDELLGNVSMRNSVYAHEILNHLPDNPYSEYVHGVLSENICHVFGEELLHSREYLNVLLDYRIHLMAADGTLTVEDNEATSDFTG